MEIDNAQRLRDWLRECPELARRPFGVDHLAREPGGFALCTLPGELKRRENILGGLEPLARQERAFDLDARLPYGAGAAQNLENLALMGRIAAWIEAQERAARYPALPEGCTALAAGVLSAESRALSQPAGIGRYALTFYIDYLYEPEDEISG